MLRCCANFPHIDLHGQKSDKRHSNTSPTILFSVWGLIAHCILHIRRPLDKKKFSDCVFVVLPLFHLQKISIIKGIIMMKRSIDNFHTSFYIPEIVPILGTHHCGNTHRESFKHC